METELRVARRISATKERKKSSWVRQLWDGRWCYLFAAPALILATMFTFYPIVSSWYFSLLQWSGFTADKTFVGLANYVELVQDKYFWDAFLRSFQFMIVGVPIQLTLALLVAIVLNDQALKLSPLFRTMFFLPVVTTAAIVGMLMTLILSPFNGPVNGVLRDLHLITQPIDFLGSPQTTLWTVIAVYIWKWLGQPMIYWLAALQTIPRELYEAAKVDGAGWWRQLWSITLPLIVPFAIVIILVTAVGALHVFPLIQTLTGGGPFFATEVMEVYIYRVAFGGETGMGTPRLGYASAAGVFFGVAVMVLALMQAWGARSLRDFRSDLQSL